MDILLAILLALNTYVFTDGTNHAGDEHAAQVIYENHWFQEREGGVIIDTRVSV